MAKDGCDRIDEERISFQTMDFLAAYSSFERRQIGVVGVIPNDLDRGLDRGSRAVEEVVIRGRPGCGICVEAQVATPGTGGGVIPLWDMMLLATIAPKDPRRRCIAFEVDPDRTVALDRVAHDRVVGRLVVIDAVVAVFIAEVSDDQVIGGTLRGCSQ